MAIVLSEVLDDRSVVLEPGARTRDAVLREIIATMPIGDRDAFAIEVIAREELHTTLMSRGIAFPHARTDLVTRIALGIGRSAAGVCFGTNAEPAQLIFVVGVPKRMINDYLVCVGTLARLASDATTRESLMNAATAAEFVEILRAGSLLLE